MVIALVLIALIVIIVLVLALGGGEKKKKRKELLKEQELKKKKVKKEMKNKKKEAKKESKRYVDLFEEGDTDVQEGITKDAKDNIEEELKSDDITSILNETNSREENFVNPNNIWEENVWQETPIVRNNTEETKDVSETEINVENENLKKEDANKDNDGFEFNSDLFGFTDNDENK